MALGIPKWCYISWVQIRVVNTPRPSATRKNSLLRAVENVSSQVALEAVVVLSFTPLRWQYRPTPSKTRFVHNDNWLLPPLPGTLTPLFQIIMYRVGARECGFAIRVVRVLVHVLVRYFNVRTFPDGDVQNISC